VQYPCQGSGEKASAEACAMSRMHYSSDVATLAISWPAATIAFTMLA